MSVKRATACEFNLRELDKHHKRLYFWTFTFPFFCRPEQVRGLTHDLIGYLRRRKCSGVRVYENHVSGSLHIHIVLNRRLGVREVREYWKSLGGGRIHVKVIDNNNGLLYIAKDLNKHSQKRGMEKGVRIYAAFGEFWKRVPKSLVGSIAFSSEDFLSYIYSRPGRIHDKVNFAFGLEHFGVGYA